nr:hypothetical protein [Pseudoclavibacter sp. Marseille-Q3772]
MDTTHDPAASTPQTAGDWHDLPLNERAAVFQHELDALKRALDDPEATLPQPPSNGCEQEAPDEA